MPKTYKNKTDRADNLRKIQAGLQKYFGNVNLTLLGTAAKLRATRAARGTKGSKQKAKIHGTVPAGNDSSQQPAPTAAPAPSATSNSTSNSASPSASPTGATNPSHP